MENKHRVHIRSGRSAICRRARLRQAADHAYAAGEKDRFHSAMAAYDRLVIADCRWFGVRP